MTKFEILSSVISVISLMVATISLLYTFSKTLRLNQGQTEINLRNNISTVRSKVEEAKMQLDEAKTQLEAQKKLYPNESPEVREAEVERRQRFLRSCIENLLNQYETACATSRDGKIDKKRFKEDYQEEIESIIQSQFFKEYFDPVRTSYPQTLRTFAEWKNRKF